MEFSRNLVLPVFFVELVVEAAGVADGVTVAVPPPEDSLGVVAVDAGVLLDGLVGRDHVGMSGMMGHPGVPVLTFVPPAAGPAAARLPDPDRNLLDRLLSAGLAVLENLEKDNK